MIRTRSYTEAVRRGECDNNNEVVVFEAVSPHPGARDDSNMRTSKVYISSSSSSSGRGDDNSNETDVNSKSFVRSESVKYYDMKQNVREIYETCCEYVSNESLQQRPPSRVSTFDGIMDAIKETTATQPAIELRIVENEDRVEVVPVGTNNNNNDFDRIEENESFYDDTKENGESQKAFPMTYTGRNSAKKSRKRPEYFGSRSKKPKRVVFRNGQTNVPLRNNIKGKARLLLDDFVTSMIECQWRWLAFHFMACNFLVWLAFAAMYYVAAYANGDLVDDPPGLRCIENGNTFTGIFTFSVETQVSIGYGEKYPNEQCPEVIFIMLMEVVVGYIMIGGMTCVVYAKIVRPKKELEGVGFGKKAVVCMRDGKLCLVIRLWDCLQKHSIGCQIRGWFVKHTTTAGPLVFSLNLGPSPLILWPTTVQHTIDEKSPMFDMSAKDLIDKRFEIIIVLSGGAKSTGQLTQSRTSYLPHEILWGSRFKTVISYKQEESSYVIDAKNLNTVEAVDTPLCSARLLKQVNDAFVMSNGGIGPTSISLPGSPLFTSPFGSPISSPQWSFRSRKLVNGDKSLNVSLP